MNRENAVLSVVPSECFERNAGCPGKEIKFSSVWSSVSSGLSHRSNVLCKIGSFKGAAEVACCTSKGGSPHAGASAEDL